MSCSNCGAENRPGNSFCRKCGQPLSMACGSCGAPLEPDDSFCGRCGTPVSGGPAAAVPEGRPAASDGTTGAFRAGAGGTPAAERRLVSILFADLVGFTTLSESRDSEEVRDLLTRYFETSRRLIGRYGGTIEKFIGDAVMAVWGTPVAQEDDAERAVRAALDLTEAVAELGTEVGAPDLRARAGVLTGEAAVTLGATGQGMVAGDLVNTASRIQSVADPGTVLVGDVTRRASEAAVAYESAGSHELKGKAEPVQLWRAVRVVAARRGAQRAHGLEAPFVGRDREMRLVKELFHASAEEGKAHLASVIGIAGIGKSRLSWEFEKYVDGLSENFWWHRGRCLAYGEGVTYWALAEMVRMRARIIEGEDIESAQAKLRATLSEHLEDPEERRWIEPRLAHLLGLEERPVADQQELFSAWRLFFERLAERQPTVLLFEDLQWADTALLDFIEYLLEWSRDHALFVLTLARHELTDRRPNWGAGKRNFTSLFLEPLAPGAMEELLRGLVPGLPDELRAKILDRAEGIPLYAVETVRMLLDRSLLVQEVNRYRPAGPVEALEVPETLQALIAARLDGLAPEERRILQDGAVMGKVFTRAGLSVISGIDQDRLDPILTSLTRKEVLTLQSDPRSPERGRYGFLQDLVRRVAYDTLSKKERKARHLAAADYLQASWGAEDGEIIEVVASHWLEAYRAAPEAADAPEIKARARDVVARAGERAASLAANEEAKRYFEQAADLAEEPLDRASLDERAGEMAWLVGSGETAAAHFERAIQLFESADRRHPAARVSARLAEVRYAEGRIEESIERMERALDVLSADEPDADYAALVAQLARMCFLRGDLEKASERVEVALDVSESLRLPVILAQSLMTKAIILISKNRNEECRALLERALTLALEHDSGLAAVRAYNNLCELTWQQDRFEEAHQFAAEGLALARKLGVRFFEFFLVGAQLGLRLVTGQWDEAVVQGERLLVDLSDDHLRDTPFGAEVLWLVELNVHRGDLDQAAKVLGDFPGDRLTEETQVRAAFAMAEAVLLHARGEYARALARGEDAFGARETLGPSANPVKQGFIWAVESALSLGDLERADQILATAESFRPGEVTPSLQAQMQRLRSRLAATGGPADPASVEPGFKMAAGMFRELGMPFWLAVTLLEHGEWLTGRDRPGEAGPLFEEAGQIFERLKARPWIERVAVVHRDRMAEAR